MKSLLLHEPMALPEREQAALAPHYAFDATPRWDGSHVTSVWHMMRDEQLWWPWFRRTEAAARKAAPEIDPASLQRRVTEVMKHPESFLPSWRAAFAYGLRRRLTEVRVPTLLASAPTDVFHHCREHAAEVMPAATVHNLPDAPATGAAQFVDFLKAQG
ncbi:MAG: hypothetical protein EXQ85_05355 [Alphaproteobacteria bacterium]|nr:hypothetical protein [Alphaproteobacteria bacterium]